MSVGMEIYGFSHFLKLKYKSCEYFNTIKNKIYKISYDSWINYVIYAEDFVLKFAPSINYLYMLSNKEFS